MKSRLLEIENLKRDPVQAQKKVFIDLVNHGENTKWGIEHQYSNISSIADFKKNVPISSYEDLFPYIERMLKGEINVLWPSQISWFAKSSGTTNARSKFIPVSKESLEDCHFQGGKDELALYIKNFPETKLFSGKSLCVGGSLEETNKDEEIFCGDVSGIIMKNLPLWAQYLRTPSLQTALMSEWEEKIDKLARESSKENVTSIAGVPTWTIILIRKVLEQTGAKDIFEVWPNLEVFFHGAVSFEPYREIFKELFPRPDMRYMEAYNASEGFFAIQDDLSRNSEMLLMPDYGVFYEFIPMSFFNKSNPDTLTIGEVELGVEYAIVISTNGGLWRYVIGDTVMFTSLYPHRIKITGRTKHFINAFGEEVVVHNTDNAIKEACNKTNAVIKEYTVAPVFMEGGDRGYHEWIIEFEKEPEDLGLFQKYLDEHLRSINSDYDAKRYKDIALSTLIIKVAPTGTFYTWMKSRGKLGGQHKVPRLSNDRKYVEEILNLM